MSTGTDRQAALFLYSVAAICWTVFVFAGTSVGISYLPNRTGKTVLEGAAMILPVWLIWCLVFRVIWKVDMDG
jgi:hypothetical protein